MTLEENIKAIREIGKNPTNRISKMKKRIVELEQKLEQTEKDLTDYQFNYPKIKELEKENGKLLQRITQLEKDVTENESDCSMCDFPKLKQDLEKEKCELLGIIQGKDKAIKDLEWQLQEVLEDNDNYQKENAELKSLKDVATLIRANNDTVTTLMQLNNMLVSKSQQLTKAKELLKKVVGSFYYLCEVNNFSTNYECLAEAEQFLKEVEK